MTYAAAISAALRPPLRGHLRCDALGGSPVDLALVAVAAADAWATGAALPAPPCAARLLTACKRVSQRHHIYVAGEHHARASAALSAIADAINAVTPAVARPAVLCAVLLDLLNDRTAPGFGAVSDELARIDRECSRVVDGVSVERIASEIAERVREEFGR